MREIPVEEQKENQEMLTNALRKKLKELDISTLDALMLCVITNKLMISLWVEQSGSDTVVNKLKNVSDNAKQGFAVVQILSDQMSQCGLKEKYPDLFNENK